ncbi:MAG: acyltransferase domain-containing protein [Pseudomonadota bacterium]
MTGIAALFPGLNSIFRERDRQRHSTLPEVAGRLSEVSRIGFKGAATKSTERLLSENDFAALAALTIAVQCGLYDRLCKGGVRPDILAGCSLGDIARSVCSGAFDYVEALEFLAGLQEQAHLLGPMGMHVAVRMPPGVPLNHELMSIFRASNLEPSVLSARHLTFGCDRAGFKRLEAICGARGLFLKDTEVPYPLHSSLMQPVIERYWRHVRYQPGILRTAAYSSVQLRRLDSVADIVDDARQVIARPLHWPETLRRLREEEGISRFINIGPCKSLLLLMRETDRRLVIETMAA